MSEICFILTMRNVNPEAPQICTFSSSVLY